MDAFNVVISEPLLVRHGGLGRLPGKQHTAQNVYAEMLLQITRSYAGLPDCRTLDEDEIEFFYNGLHDELIEATKPKG